MLRAHRNPDRFRTFDLTPMIDVVFQLIIFFMFTSQFGQISRTDVDLPTEKGEQSGESVPSLVVDITREGAYVVDARPLAFDRVLALVDREIQRSGGPEAVTVLIRPDRDAAAGALNRLAEEMAEIGVRRWSIGTRQEPGS